jgi:hypothetical protein
MALSDHETLIQEVLDGSHKSVEVCVNLDLDLLHMVYSNQFLGENFIKCFFRYYALLPEYTAEIFLSQLRDPKM